MPKIRCTRCDNFKYASEISELRGLCHRCFVLPVCFAELSASTPQVSENSPKRNTEKSALKSAVIALTATSLTTHASIAELIKKDASSAFVRVQVTVVGITADKTILSFDLINKDGDFVAHVGTGEFNLGEAAAFPALH